MQTRLVPPVTENEAALLNTAFLLDAADNILSAAALAGISGWMAYAPAGFGKHRPEQPSVWPCPSRCHNELAVCAHGAEVVR